MTGSEFHRVACLSLVCRDRVDCKENIPIYFLPPPSTRVQRFPAKCPLTKRPSEGNSQIIAQLLSDAMLLHIHIHQPTKKAPRLQWMVNIARNMRVVLFLILLVITRPRRGTPPHPISFEHLALICNHQFNGN